MDSKGHLLAVDVAVARIFGYSTADEMLHSSQADIGHLLEADARRKFLRLLKKHGRVDDFEACSLRKGGDSFWTRWSAWAVLDASGQLLHYEGVLTEDLDHKGPELGSLAGADNYRTLVEYLPAVLFLDAADEHETTLYISPKVEALLGYTPEEWKARPSIWKESLHPDDKQRVLAENKRSHETGDAFQAEYRLKRKDGVYVWVREEALVIKDANGAPVFWQGFLLDISAQKEAEEAVRQSDASYRGLFDSVQEAIYIQGKDGRFLDVNEGAVRMYGYPREFFIGKTPEAVSAPGLNALDAVRMALEQAFQGEPQQFEFWGRRASGEVFPKDVRLYKGTYFGQEVVFALAQDITERKQAEDALLTTADMLRRQVEELTILQQVAMAASTASSVDGLIERVIDIISDSLYPDTCGVALTSEDGKEIRIHPASHGVPHYLDASKPTLIGVIGEVVKSGRAIRLGDVKQDEAYIEGVQGVQSELCVPIKKGEKVIGVINVGSKEADAFSEGDERLLYTIAGTLATAFEKLRLLEDEQRRRQEAELLHEATAALTGSLDLPVLYEAILENLAKMVPYDSASMTLVDGDNLTLVAGRGLPEGYDWVGKRFVFSEKWEKIFSGHAPVVMADAQTNGHFEAWEGMEYIRGWMGVPLISQGKIIGLLNVNSKQVNAFGPREALLAQTFAHSAAVAIENARQFETAQRHLRESEALRITAEAITSSLDTQEILHVVLDNLSLVIPYDSATVFLLDGTVVRLMASRGLPYPKIAISSTFPTEDALLQEIWSKKQPVILVDAQKDERFHRWGETDYVHVWMGVPLLFQGELRGCLTMDSWRTEAYTQHDAAVAMAFAHQAALAFENARLYERSRKQVRQLTALRDIDTAISASFDLKVTLNILLAHTVEELEVDAAIIWLYLPSLHSLAYHTSIGFANKFAFPQTPVHIERGLAGQAVSQRDLIYVRDLSNHLTEVCQPVAEEKFQIYFGIPLMNKGQIQGVLEVYSRAPFVPDADWLTYLRTLAGQAAIAIDNAQLFRNLQRSNQELMLAYDTTLEGWGKALELRDKETEGHTQRVTAMTLKLASRLGIEGEQLTHILRGSLLHDIGKMGIPDHILKKPGPLTPEEWEIMRQHPQYAYDLLFPISYLRPALDIPYCHHERWDGSGYPRGLKGEEIPLAARIFAVVDIWDALLYDRPYRQAWTTDKTMAYLRSKAGSELDPDIVEIFLQLLDEKQGEGNNL
ncbi:MAG: hypothetical protein Fur0043_21920 [Anaerolineales bacterium]